MARNGDKPEMSEAEELLVIVGTARLPEALSQDGLTGLLLELTVEPRTNRIIDVAASIQLPSYVALLKQALVSQSLDRLEDALERIRAHLQGPLVRPTVAALQHAVSSCPQRVSQSNHHAAL